MTVYVKDYVVPPVVVNPQAPLTISTQITEQIKLLIARGNLQPNQLLPPVTHLAKHLQVNHTTIAQVYSDLTNSGYLVAQRGKGTFVADSVEVKRIVARKNFYDLLGQAFQMAVQSGWNASEFAAAAYARAVQADPRKLKALFVNFLPDTLNASGSISGEIDLPLMSVSWEQLQEREPTALQQLLAADLVVTTASNLWDVARIADPKKEVIGIDLRPDLQLLSAISSLPHNAKVLFVCQESRSSEAMQQIATNSIHHIKSSSVTLDCLRENPQSLHQFDLVVCSQQVESELARLIPPSLKLMVFKIAVDPVNLLVLQARLAAVEMEKLV